MTTTWQHFLYTKSTILKRAGAELDLNALIINLITSILQEIEPKTIHTVCLLQQKRLLTGMQLIPSGHIAEKELWKKHREYPQ